MISNQGSNKSPLVGNVKLNKNTDFGFTAKFWTFFCGVIHGVLLRRYK